MFDDTPAPAERRTRGRLRLGRPDVVPSERVGGSSRDARSRPRMQALSGACHPSKRACPRTAPLKTEQLRPHAMAIQRCRHLRNIADRSGSTDGRVGSSPIANRCGRAGRRSCRGHAAGRRSRDGCSRRCRSSGTARAPCGSRRGIPSAAYCAPVSSAAPSSTRSSTTSRSSSDTRERPTRRRRPGAPHRAALRSCPRELSLRSMFPRAVAVGVSR